jgi:hypothetical protein
MLDLTENSSLVCAPQKFIAAPFAPEDQREKILCFLNLPSWQKEKGTALA